jgi:UDP-N-acetylglucosamine acyltransferase
MAIHPTAIVDPRRRSTPSVEIGPYTVIGPHVKHRRRHHGGAHAVIEGHTTIGRDNRIFQFGSLGAANQDKKYAGEPCELVIGDRNTIREFTTLQHRHRAGGGVTRVGNDNWMMAYTHLAHDCVVGDHTIFANNSHAGRPRRGGRLGHPRRLHGRAPVRAHRRPRDDGDVLAAVSPTSRRSCMSQASRLQARSMNFEGLRRRGFSPPAHRRRQGDAQGAVPRRPHAGRRAPAHRRLATGHARGGADVRGCSASWRGCRRSAASCADPWTRASRWSRARASGDLLAGLLLGACARRWPDLQSAGIGGPRWRRHGFEPGGRTTSWRCAATSRCCATTARSSASAANCASGCCGAAAIVHRRRRARLQPRPGSDLRAGGIKTVHFVCPSIWAWRPKRVEKIRAPATTCCASSRSSPTCWRRHGVAATYVGHPLANVIPLEPDQAGRADSPGPAARGEVIAILPGSRKSEIQYLAKRFFEAAALLRKAAPRRAASWCRRLPACARHRAAIAAAGPAGQVTVVDGQSHAGAGGLRRDAGRQRHGHAGSGAVQAADGHRVPR